MTKATIAISIDVGVLARLDRFVSGSSGASRSQLIHDAQSSALNSTVKPMSRNSGSARYLLGR